MIHDLKTWPEYFEAVMSGAKRFEVRRDDRGFAVGHVLRLREWSPNTGTYTGRETRRTVSYILDGGDFGVERGYCVLGLGGDE